MNTTDLINDLIEYRDLFGDQEVFIDTGEKALKSLTVYYCNYPDGFTYNGVGKKGIYIKGYKRSGPPMLKVVK